MKRVAVPFSLKISHWLLIAIVIVGFIGTTAGYAYGHYVKEDTLVWSNEDGDCLYVISEISHGSGGGYSKVRVKSTVFAVTFCLGPWYRAEGQLGAQWSLLKWDGADWAECAYAVYEYNTSLTNDFTVDYDFGSEPWCGSGWYGTWGDGTVQDNDNNWQVGSLWSGSHSF